MPYFMYYVSHLTPEERDENIMSLAEFTKSVEMMQGYEPMKKCCTYQVYVERQRKKIEETKEVSYTFRRIVVMTADDAVIKETEKSELFVRWYK